MAESRITLEVEARLVMLISAGIVIYMTVPIGRGKGVVTLML